MMENTPYTGKMYRKYNVTSDDGSEMRPHERAEEIQELLTWLNEHPSFHLNTGHLLIARCPRCGDTVRVCDALIFSGVPCVVCGAPMDMLRWRVAERVRKNPYSFGRLTDCLCAGIHIESLKASDNAEIES